MNRWCIPKRGPKEVDRGCTVQSSHHRSHRGGQIGGAIFRCSTARAFKACSSRECATEGRLKGGGRVTEGDGEDDSGEDQTYEFLDPIDTDEQFENVVDALRYDVQGVEVLVDVPGSKRFSNESTHRASVRSRRINSLRGQAGVGQPVGSPEVAHHSRRRTR